MKNVGKAILILLAVYFSLAVISCGGGGGGGGDGELNPADIFMEVEPRRIDSGDRLRVKLFLSRIHEDGVLLKIRYPRRMSYVTNSTIITVGKAVGRLNPGIETTPGTSASTKSYIVYDLPHSIFGAEDNAEIELILEGEGSINNGQIEVDPDFNDPTQTINQKFDGLQPQFDAEDSIDIQVNDSSGNISPTITPTPTVTPTPTSTNTVPSA